MNKSWSYHIILNTIPSVTWKSFGKPLNPVSGYMLFRRNFKKLIIALLLNLGLPVNFHLLWYNAAQSVESKSTSERNMSPPPSGRRISQERFAVCFTLVAFLAYSSTLEMDAILSSEMSVDFKGLHGIISQKKQFFITTVLRTSNRN